MGNLFDHRGLKEGLKQKIYARASQTQGLNRSVNLARVVFIAELAPLFRLS